MRLEQRQRLRDERHWCAKNIASCERDLKRIPWLGLLGLSVIPAGWTLGFLGVMLALLGTVALVGFSVYLVTGHRAEYQLRLAEIDQKLAKDEAKKNEDAG